MPSRAPTVCSACGAVHPAGERCPTAKRWERERKTRFDAKRPSARARGYGPEWERARAEYLAAYPSCRRCGQPATVVDHIKPHKGDQVLFWDRRNWQALCAHCHNAAKQREERRSHKEK